MTTEHKTRGLAELGHELPSAAEIQQIIERTKQKRNDEDQIRRAAAEQEKRHQQELFLADKLTPEFIDLIMTRVRTAAESGATELMIGQFPSDWCTDGGRRINVPEQDWPDTLQGIAREFYEFWERELKPKGFGLRAQIISFPDGKPGDVGAFLSWDRPV